MSNTFIIDLGSIGNGLQDKNLTLDISKRIASISK